MNSFGTVIRSSRSSVRSSLDVDFVVLRRPAWRGQGHNAYQFEIGQLSCAENRQTAHARPDDGDALASGARRP